MNTKCEIVIEKGVFGENGILFKYYGDLTIANIANDTLDLTQADSRFPRKTGNLEHQSAITRPRKESECMYCLDVPAGAEYAQYVWEYPQDTNWTNPSTYAQWFSTTYSNNKDRINTHAISEAIRITKHAEKEVNSGVIKKFISKPIAEKGFLDRW